MTWWTALRNLRGRWFGTLLTVLAIALAGSIALVVPMLLNQVDRGASDAAQVFDLLVTAKGGEVQAVTSAVFLLDAPIGNVPLSLFEELVADERTTRVVPVALGDALQGFRLVGTDHTMFDVPAVDRDGPYLTVREGGLFSGPFEAVLGAAVAAELGMSVGDSFTTAHGFDGTGGEVIPAAQAHAHEDEHAHEEGHAHEDDGHSHAEEYLVTGILEPTGGPFDRAVFTDMDSTWLIHGQLNEAGREVTAMFVSARQINHYYELAGEINAGTDAQAVFIGSVFGQLRGVVQQGESVYQLISVLVLILAALTISLYIYAGSLARQRQVSLLRALGAGRAMVFGVIMLETFVAAVIGVALAIGLSLLSGGFISGVLADMLGFSLPAPALEPVWLVAVSGLIPLTMLVALSPALQAAGSSPLEHLN